MNMTTTLAVSRHLLAPVVALLLLLPTTARAQPDTRSIDSIVEEALKAWKVPGAAVAVVQDDKVIHLKGYGVRELGGDRPVTSETLFTIASLTKAFTCTAIAMLADDGKLAWDDPVRKHLEYFRLSDPLASDQATLRDLVCHRTGLSRHDLLWQRAPWDLEETVRRAGHVKLTNTFRSTYDYANIPYIAAGLAVANVTHGTWQDTVRERIFVPLGMKAACFDSIATRKSPDYATAHILKDGKIVLVPWFDDQHQVRASGSIRASAADMARWLRFQLGDGSFEGKRLLSASKLAETHAPQMAMPVNQPYAREGVTHLMSYGLGWIRHDYRGQLVITHGGSTDGFRARAALVPQRKLGIVILANLGENPFPEAVRDNLLDLLIGLPRKDWVAIHRSQAEKTEADQKARQAKLLADRQKGTKPSHDLSAYVGLYDDKAYGTTAIGLADNKLKLMWSSFEVELEHYHYDTFLTGGDSRISGELAQFILRPNGEVGELRFLGQDFKKSK